MGIVNQKLGIFRRNKFVFFKGILGLVESTRSECHQDRALLIDQYESYQGQFESRFVYLYFPTKNPNKRNLKMFSHLKN
jgi:hypothetical protein